MKKEIALKIILAIAIVGMLFSGYLSYGELFGNACPLGGCAKIAGLPTCLYGFVIYLVVLIIAITGLCCENKKKKR
jgi:uncharacterized membrane protein